MKPEDYVKKIKNRIHLHQGDVFETGDNEAVDASGLASDCTYEIISLETEDDTSGNVVLIHWEKNDRGDTEEVFREWFEDQINTPGVLEYYNDERVLVMPEEDNIVESYRLDHIYTTLIPTGLYGKDNLAIFDSLAGQLSDGMWENSSRMTKYWEYMDYQLDELSNEVMIRVPRDYRWYLGFESPSDIKRWIANHLKAIVKEYIKYNEGEWSRDCTTRFDGWFHSPTPEIREVYRVYDKLLGRKDRVGSTDAYLEGYAAEERLEEDLTYNPKINNAKVLTLTDLGGEMWRIKFGNNILNIHKRPQSGGTRVAFEWGSIGGSPLYFTSEKEAKDFVNNFLDKCNFNFSRDELDLRAYKTRLKDITGFIEIETDLGKAYVPDYCEWLIPGDINFIKDTYLEDYEPSEDEKKVDVAISWLFEHPSVYDRFCNHFKYECKENGEEINKPSYDEFFEWFENLNHDQAMKDYNNYVTSLYPHLFDTEDFVEGLGSEIEADLNGGYFYWLDKADRNGIVNYTVSNEDDPRVDPDSVTYEEFDTWEEAKKFALEHGFDRIIVSSFSFEGPNGYDNGDHYDFEEEWLSTSHELIDKQKYIDKINDTFLESLDDIKYKGKGCYLIWLESSQKYLEDSFGEQAKFDTEEEAEDYINRNYNNEDLMLGYELVWVPFEKDEYVENLNEDIESNWNKLLDELAQNKIDYDIEYNVSWNPNIKEIVRVDGNDAFALCENVICYGEELLYWSKRFNARAIIKATYNMYPRLYPSLAKVFEKEEDDSFIEDLEKPFYIIINKKGDKIFLRWGSPISGEPNMRWPEFLDSSKLRTKTGANFFNIIYKVTTKSKAEEQLEKLNNVIKWHKEQSWYDGNYDNEEFIIKEINEKKLRELVNSFKQSIDKHNEDWDKEKKEKAKKDYEERKEQQKKEKAAREGKPYGVYRVYIPRNYASDIIIDIKARDDKEALTLGIKEAHKKGFNNNYYASGDDGYIRFNSAHVECIEEPDTFVESAKLNETMKTITLSYPNLEITVWRKVSNDSYDPTIGGMGGWSPAEYDDEEIEIEYDYEASQEEIEEVLFNQLMDEEDFKKMTETELQEYIHDNIDNLVDEYESDLLEYFKDSAREEAEQNYEPDEPDYEPDYEPEFDDFEPDTFMEDADDKKFYKLNPNALCAFCPNYSFGDRGDPIACKLKQVNFDGKAFKNVWFTIMRGDEARSVMVRVDKNGKNYSFKLNKINDIPEHIISELIDNKVIVDKDSFVEDLDTLYEDALDYPYWLISKNHYDIHKNDEDFDLKHWVALGSDSKEQFKEIIKPEHYGDWIVYNSKTKEFINIEDISDDSFIESIKDNIEEDIIINGEKYSPELKYEPGDILIPKEQKTIEVRGKNQNIVVAIVKSASWYRIGNPAVYDIMFITEDMINKDKIKDYDYLYNYAPSDKHVWQEYLDNNYKKASSENLNDVIDSITKDVVVEDVKKEIKIQNNENIIEDEKELNPPIDLEYFPNNMGINLCSVKSEKWTEQDDGQLKKIEIDFDPANEEEKAEQSIEEDIEKHDTLNPKLFDGEELKPEVTETIEKVVKEFTDELANDGIKFDLKDIVLLGSNVSYNYTKDSDLDVHLIADSSNLTCPDNLYPLLYSAYRSMFNHNYDITIHGIPAELFVEMDECNAKSNGIYSLKDGWVRKPVQTTIPDLDKEAFDKLFKEWEDKYFALIGKGE